MKVRTKTVPSWVGANAERVLASRGDAERLKRVVDRASVPIVIVDSERRYVEANCGARLLFRLSLAELRQLKIEDLTDPRMYPTLMAAWQRLMSAGCVAGPYEVASPDGSRIEISYYALADALPGLHLIAFAPATWADDELLAEDEKDDRGAKVVLTPREIDVLQLAAQGYSNPMIAKELVLSIATVKSHFENLYSKLAVRDRAAAVAKAMRHGVIS